MALPLLKTCWQCTSLSLTADQLARVDERSFVALCHLPSDVLVGGGEATMLSSCRCHSPAHCQHSLLKTIFSKFTASFWANVMLASPHSWLIRSSLWHCVLVIAPSTVRQEHFETTFWKHRWHNVADILYTLSLSLSVLIGLVFVEGLLLFVGWGMARQIQSRNGRKERASAECAKLNTILSAHSGALFLSALEALVRIMIDYWRPCVCMQVERKDNKDRDTRHIRFVDDINNSGEAQPSWLPRGCDENPISPIFGGYPNWIAMKRARKGQFLFRFVLQTA